jgi:hypothetical protein
MEKISSTKQIESRTDEQGKSEVCEVNISVNILDFVLKWKQIFIERYRLRSRWLNGRCDVKTYHGHVEGKRNRLDKYI